MHKWKDLHHSSGERGAGRNVREVSKVAIHSRAHDVCRSGRAECGLVAARLEGFVLMQ
jgi:hypothetical protein